MSFLDFSAEHIDEEIDSKFSPINNYFANKNILLTGGTGFLGLLYVEKLLRSDVKTLYILIRPKKNVMAMDRIKKLYTGTLFKKLESSDRNYLNRIRVIEGDLSELKLGISEENLQDIYNNVDIVLHAASEVRFDQKLVILLLNNLRGTRELLKICEKIKKLELFTYISTAYSNCTQSVINEKIYNRLADPNKMIELAEKISKDPAAAMEFEIMTDRIIRPFPNTYTYSKNLSEMLVNQYSEKLNVCIIRPSIVISTHEDPIPGWCNNLYGLNGVMFAVGLGLCRLIPINGKTMGDVVCADFVINSTLAAMWYTKNELKNENNKIIENPQVFHVNTCMDRPLVYNNFKAEILKSVGEVLPYRTLWKSCYNMITCPFMWKYLTIWYHVIPSLFFDCYFSLANKKLRILPVYRKTQYFMESLKYFMQNEWQFTNANMKKVWDAMSPYDKEFYPSDVRRLEWSSYSYTYLLGLLVYLGDESLDNKEKSQKKHKMLNILHVFVLCIYYGIHILLFTLFANYFGILGKLETNFSNTVEFLKNPY